MDPPSSTGRCLWRRLGPRMLTLRDSGSSGLNPNSRLRQEHAKVRLLGSEYSIPLLTSSTTTTDENDNRSTNCTDGRGENSFSKNSRNSFSNTLTDSLKEEDGIPMFGNNMHEAEDSDVHITDITENGDQHSSRRKWNLPISVFFRDARKALRRDELSNEIIGIAFPAILTLIANPITSFIHKAIIRYLGEVELAAVETSIAGYNQAVNLFTFTLASITASFVANEISFEKIRADSAQGESTKMKMLVPEERGSEASFPAEDHTASTSSKERQRIPSAFAAIVVAGILGVMLTLSLSFGAETFLAFMGVTPGSREFTSARRNLKLRSLGAPASLLYFAGQGVFQGFKDTRTPLYATVAGRLANIALDPILVFVCHLGSSGAAIAHAFSQYLIFFLLLWMLMKRVHLLPPSPKDMRFRQFLKTGLLMSARGVAVACCSGLAVHQAGRLDSTPSAAFTICLKVWSTSSVIAGGLAIAGQAILACEFAKKDYHKVIAAATRVAQMAFVLGLGVAVIVGAGLKFGSGVFSKDANVQRLIFKGIPFAAATQPFNSLAVVFDGINFGATDFTYSSCSMVLVSIIASLFLISKNNTLSGIWAALTVYTVLRTVACIGRMGTGTGPWRFLREGPQRL